MDAVDRGKELKRLRELANLTQRNVADHFGITPSAVSEWERGFGSPEWPKIRALDHLFRANGKVLELFDMGAGAADPWAEIAAIREELREMRAIVDLLAAEEPPEDATPQPGDV